MAPLPDYDAFKIADEFQPYNELGHNYFKLEASIGAQFQLHGCHTCRGRVVPKAIVAREAIKSTV